jgi:ATP-dependent RNA helicase DDX24/MAK5
VDRDDAIPAEFNDDAQSKDDDETPDESGQGLQTFVFSATLSKDLQRNLKRRSRPRLGKKSHQPASTLGKAHRIHIALSADTFADDLLLKLDFRDPDPEIIDLSPEGGVVFSLRESRIECVATDKDVYLYYFLLRYPGRTLVFLSSIDGIRRLLPLLTNLDVSAYPLHAQLEQRQRLKNLDRFKSATNSVLLATDVAARGLDIPAVDHVIHFQLPRTADAYVHRNGRTARAQQKGFSMLMISAEERKLFRTLMTSLKRSEYILNL